LIFDHFGSCNEVFLPSSQEKEGNRAKNILIGELRDRKAEQVANYEIQAQCLGVM